MCWFTGVCVLRVTVELGFSHDDGFDFKEWKGVKQSNLQVVGTTRVCGFKLGVFKSIKNEGFEKHFLSVFPSYFARAGVSSLLYKKQRTKTKNTYKMYLRWCLSKVSWFGEINLALPAV